MTLEGPPRTTVTYGYDRLLGFFVSVTKDHRLILEYDALQSAYNGLPGLLDELVNEHVFSREAFHDALEQLQLVDDLSEIEDRGEDNVRLAAEMLSRLKAAAGE